MINRILLEITLVIYKICRTIYSLFIWLFAFVTIIFYGLMALRIYVLFTGKRKEAAYIGAYTFSVILLWLLGIKVIRNGIENISKGRNSLFASNHASILDLLIIAASMPVHFVFAMDDQLFKIPFFGAICRFLCYLEVSRTNPRKAQQDIQKMIDRLKQGETVVIFGEGGRSRDGLLHNFKSGVGVLAGESGVPVIPVAISGSYRLMRRRSVIIYPGKVQIKFGAVMSFGPDEPPVKIAARIHDTVAELLKD
jgi:1-acyl-sn-glycerol-3-phosphate acyltransferase